MTASKERLWRSPLPLLLIIITMLASACAKQPMPGSQPSEIGPFSQFSARLIVIEPKHRWQVMLQSPGESDEKSEARLNHAATGTVIELRWSGDQMQVRSTEARTWKSIGPAQLGSQGIVIPPQQLAAILLGEMPSHFKPKKQGLWESRDSGSPIRLQWTESLQKLTMTDIKHGRQATMLIQP